MKKNLSFPRHWARRFIVLLLALGLITFFFSPLQAQEEEKAQKDKLGSHVMQMIQRYEKQGFHSRGPLQVSRVPENGMVDFSEHKPAYYELIRVLDEQEEVTDLDKDDWVYLLQKKEQIILIRLNQELFNQEGRSNVQ